MKKVLMGLCMMLALAAMGCATVGRSTYTVPAISNDVAQVRASVTLDGDTAVESEGEAVVKCPTVIATDSLRLEASVVNDEVRLKWWTRVELDKED